MRSGHITKQDRPVPSGEVSLCGLDTDLDVEAMANDLARVTRAYIATDDGEEVRELMVYIGQHSKRLARPASRRRLRGVDQIARGESLFGERTMFQQNEDRRQHVVSDVLEGRGDAMKLMLEAISNMILLAASDVFVGTADSGFSKVAAALGCANGHFMAAPVQLGHWGEADTAPNLGEGEGRSPHFLNGLSVPLKERAKC